MDGRASSVERALIIHRLVSLRSYFRFPHKNRSLPPVNVPRLAKLGDDARELVRDACKAHQGAHNRFITRHTGTAGSSSAVSIDAIGCHASAPLTAWPRCDKASTLTSLSVHQGMANTVSAAQSDKKECAITSSGSSRSRRLVGLDVNEVLCQFCAGCILMVAPPTQAPRIRAT